ncbi:hypothetical protein E2C01_019806 [Portunus trituberculatus]|uniref:Uncharacterized protein n=1 Tax=Portunus trituberculatus TaxID=210409 RepID=A0A5B7DZV3_PORTR|nr:hypothetical protein [Portunus trituberculatus]
MMQDNLNPTEISQYCLARVSCALQFTGTAGELYILPLGAEVFLRHNKEDLLGRRALFSYLHVARMFLIICALCRQLPRST